MTRILPFVLACCIALGSHTQTPCINGFADGFPCSNIDLMSEMSLSQLGATENTNDIWGWTSPNTGHEYALIGCNNGTSFVDISDPVNPVKIGFLPSHTNSSLWRDIKTQGNYAFIVSEASNHGMQVFDLTQLDNAVNIPIAFTETAHYNAFGHAHNIAINDDTPYAYCVGSNTMSGGLHIVNISNPLAPVIAGGFSLDGYTHDCQAVIYHGPDQDYTGKEIVFACNEDMVTIVDVNDKTDCEMISTVGYPQTAYTHQGWLTTDHKYFLVGDEQDETHFGVGTRTLMFNVQDLDAPVFMGYYQSTSPAIDHNLYIIDHFVYESNYRSGVRILDNTRVANTQLTQIGYFDVSPSNDNPQYSGSWSNYSWFKSGNIIATDMYDGFVVLRPTLVVLEENAFEVCGDNEISFQLSVNANLQFPLTVSLEGIPGSATASAIEITAPGNFTVTLGNLSSVPMGNHDGQLVLNTTFGEAYHFPITIHTIGLAATAPGLSTPSDGSPVSNSASSVDFSWNNIPAATSYTFELATDELFSNIVNSQDLALPMLSLAGPLADGVYYWRVKSISNCNESGWSSVFSFTVMTVGINEISGNRLSVYPNPAGNQLVISSLKKINGKMDVVDVTGRKVESIVWNDTHQYVLDISDYTSGVYFLQGEFGMVRFMKK